MNEIHHPNKQLSRVEMIFFEAWTLLVMSKSQRKNQFLEGAHTYLKSEFCRREVNIYSSKWSFLSFLRVQQRLA